MNERDETEIGRFNNIIPASRHSKKALPPERIELSIS